MNPTDEYLKPVPAPNPDTQPYWDALNDGRLVLQRCTQCARVRHYPRPMCDNCYSTTSDWVDAQGVGTVYSWTETHHAFSPGFKGELPYTLVTVELAEGVRINAQLRDARVDELEIGTPVTVGFELARADLVLPIVRLSAPIS
jgi:uncharacterized protein